VLATIGAVVSFLGGKTQNDALYLKNEAVLKRSEASDCGTLSSQEPEGKLQTRCCALRRSAKIEFYNKEAPATPKERGNNGGSATLRQRIQGSNEQAEHALHPHHKLAISVTFLQIVIALASVAALTNKRWLLYGAGVGALVGCALGAFAWFV
jgi:hypothetical protein